MSIKDMPDNYPWLPNDARYPMVDVGELAVRLGSIVTYDRRGTVVWMDDFAYGLGPWQTDISGDGSAIAIVTANNYRGADDVLLTAGTDLNKSASIYKFFAHSNIERVGLECAFGFITDIDYVIFALRRMDGVWAHQAEIKLDYVGKVIQYLDSGNVYRTIDSIAPYYDAAGSYNLLKLVADFETDKYVRLMYNENVYSLSAYNIYTVENGLAPRTWIQIDLFGIAVANKKLQVAHVIITAGET